MTLDDVTVSQFRDAGYVAPIDVLTAAEAAEVLRKFEEAEQHHPEQLHAENRNNAHLIFPFLADLVAHPAIVSAVRSLVGGDIALSGTVLFVKEPGTGSFVSWHQDATYMGMAPDNFVTGWLALNPSTVESGCVAVIPGSHVDGRRDHTDTFDEQNILTRGQKVADIDESTAVNLELQPGQFSLHHPWVVHGSLPNQSEHRRIGIAFQSYMGGDVRPTRGTHYAMHVAGIRPHSSFLDATRPWGECTDAGLALRAKANEALADVLYDGAETRRKY